MKKIEAKEEWFEPDFAAARRRIAELRVSAEHERAREALARIHASLTQEDYEVPDEEHVARFSDLDRLGPVYSKIVTSYRGFSEVAG